MQYQALHHAFWNTGTFWVTVAVFLFLAVFGGKLVRGIVAAIDARADGIRREIDEAQRLRREAEEMLREAERRQSEALETARQMTQDAERRAARLAEALARDTEAAQARREAVVGERITAASAAAIKEVREAATALAVDAAARALREMLGPEDDHHGVDHAVAALPAALRNRAA